MTTTIQDKTSIIDGLQHAFQTVIDYVEQQDPATFCQAPKPGKWSPAQQLEHLIKSTAPLNQGLRMPKFTLRTMFGQCNRPERTYDEVVEKYEKMLADGAKATSRYVPGEKSSTDRATLIEQLKNEGDKLVAIVDKWDEKRLSKLLLPHPILGKMTVREMLFFTINHTLHHARSIKESF